MNHPYRYSGIISEALVKRKLFDYWKILLVSISPVLAIVASLLWNQAGRAQEWERVQAGEPEIRETELNSSFFLLPSL